MALHTVIVTPTSTTPSPVSAPKSTARAPAFATKAQLVDAVLVRRSVRTFEPTPLRAEHAALVEAYLADPERTTGPFGHRGRIELLHGVGSGDREIGTYGYVAGYQSVLVGISPDEPLALTDLAYAMHGLVLQLTHAGVGSVWLGAAFNRAEVLASTRPADGELIAAMIPIGYTKDKRMLERFMRVAIRSDHRKPMDTTFRFGDLSTPLGDEGGLLRRPLEIARRAPSAKNKQSWRVVVSRDESRLDVYAAFGLRHQVGVGRKKYACPPEYLDLGTFLLSLELGLASEGIDAELVRDDPGLAIPPGADLEYIATLRRR